jgi:hypothetical protein
MYFLSELRVDTQSTVYTDALDLIKLVSADHPKPTAKHMLIELRTIQSKLSLSEKEIRKLVTPLRSLHDVLNFIPSKRIEIKHIAGALNPADPLSKPVDLHTLVSKYMTSLA